MLWPAFLADDVDFQPAVIDGKAGCPDVRVYSGIRQIETIAGDISVRLVQQQQVVHGSLCEIVRKISRDGPHPPGS